MPHQAHSDTVFLLEGGAENVTTPPEAPKKKAAAKNPSWASSS